MRRRNYRIVQYPCRPRNVYTVGDWLSVGIASLIAVLAFIGLLALFLASVPVHARDLNGTYTDSPLHSWFDSLSSGKGMCCSFADGRSVEDPDWGADDKGYWVIVDGKRYSVPADALVSVPNKFGRAVVWPYVDGNGQTQIRCFIPGAGA